MTILANRSSRDREQIERLGLRAAQRSLGKLRVGAVRALRDRRAGRYAVVSANAELSKNLVPVLARAMAFAHAMGERRAYLSLEQAEQDLSLDIYSDVRKVLRKTLVPDVAGLEKAYAGRAMQALNELGAGADKKLYAAMSQLADQGITTGSAIEQLRLALDHAGIGEVGQSRLETVFNTEIALASGVGQWLGYRERWNQLWGFRYVQIDRPTKREEHVPFDGTTLPKDDPFWLSHWPPNGWNCGCQVEPVVDTPWRASSGKRKRGPRKGGHVDKGFGTNPGAILEQAIKPSLKLDWQSQTRAPAGESTGGQWVKEAEFPHYGLESLEHIKKLGGSTGAELYEDALGNKFVMKRGASAAHIQNEHAANQAYRALGVAAPDSKMYEDEQGPYMLSRFVEGTPLSDLHGDEYDAAVKKLQKDFAADALLANWDVIGLSKDNVIVDKNGTPWRIDNGGALAYRAKGGSKGDKWSGDAGEVKSMRTTGTAGQVFGSLSDQDVKEQIGKLQFDKATVAVKDINLAATLTKREASMKAWAAGSTSTGKLETKPSAELAPAKSWMGSTPEQRLAFLKKQSLPMNANQMKHTAILNDGTHNDAFVTLKSLKQEAFDDIKKKFPDKKLKLVAKADVFAKTGSTKTSEVWKKTSTGEVSGYYQKHGLTAEAKKIAMDDQSISKAMKKKIADMPTIQKFEKQLPAFSKEFDTPLFVRQHAEDSTFLQHTISHGNMDAIEEQRVVWQKNLYANNLHAMQTFHSWKGSANPIRKAEVKLSGTNDAYASHHVSDDMKKGVEAMHAEQEKAPKFHGVLFRGVSHVAPGSTFYEALNTVGSNVKLLATAGGSRSIKIGSSFSSGVCLLRVATKNGVMIESIGGHSSEVEVQIPINTKFRVVNVAHDIKVQHQNKKHQNIHLLVDLEEIGKDEPVQHELVLSDPPEMRRDNLVEDDPDVFLETLLPVE